PRPANPFRGGQVFQGRGHLGRDQLDVRAGVEQRRNPPRRDGAAAHDNHPPSIKPQPQQIRIHPAPSHRSFPPAPPRAAPRAPPHHPHHPRPRAPTTRRAAPPPRRAAPPPPRPTHPPPRPATPPRRHPAAPPPRRAAPPPRRAAPPPRRAATPPRRPAATRATRAATQTETYHHNPRGPSGRPDYCGHLPPDLGG